MLEGLTFFTTSHTAAEGAVPIANQPFCLGCHMNSADGYKAASFDLPRSLADDALPHQNSGAATGREFRNSPLMGIGRIGLPFLHDGRVYLSNLTVKSTPSSTVYSDGEVTNGPLVVRSVDDALRAAIELHDLPAPDTRTSPNGGCLVPKTGSLGEATYANVPAISAQPMEPLRRWPTGVTQGRLSLGSGHCRPRISRRSSSS